MKKPEAVKIVRSEAHTWYAEADRPEDPDFDEFLRWLKLRNPTILKFRSVMGPYEDLEQTWAEELKQRWKY